ncbi:hypothetical protein [Tenggerimyces flavus]|uniref:Heparin-sulfate lyase N-terminal domain-containing protein n=1 Tax=Tenggerimyces flavus TaxID=1708749 RepID=A0ABV7YM88_9ACTN|nr:hypothetical protein [Tenggerimyces flavus]MBM7786193.1 hypothetical protein [Tenggerimyces flavus]
MRTDRPFLLEDMDELRERVLAEEGTRRAELWNLLRNSARSAPADFGWFVPFVAVVTRDPDDIERARQLVFTYLDKLDPMSFCSGLQFHFWCFAFPHAKVALYFQWLCTVDAFTAEERERISEQLIAYHFVNFYYGMRTKPEPECVDNQALSLCLSNTIVGQLFADGSRMAGIMLRDGLRRLPGLLSDLPVSGYTGEGSSYMDCVNGPAIPLAVEVLERITGETGLLHRSVGEEGALPVSVLRMVARSFMPGGLLLPWDNYGYQWGVRSTLAYGALRTREPIFQRVLENECIWTYDIGIGWAYDDLVWTLIWWPDEPPVGDDDGRSWYEPHLGAALVSADGDRYAMQLWDESEPDIPTRSHVNPNAVLFNGFRTPISADGSPTPDAPHRFQFDDTWRTVGFLAIDTETRYNYGDGCAGAHSVIVVDGAESMRAHAAYDQVLSSSFGPGLVEADVTPIYRENFPDVRVVSRRTRLHLDRFFTVEDTFEAESEHLVTSRFLFRPGVARMDRGVRVETPEGVTLQLIELWNDDELRIERVENHPYKPDGRSELVDFSVRGREVRRLFVALISRTRADATELAGFRVVPDAAFSLSEAVAALERSTDLVPMRLPAYMETGLSNPQRWWYMRMVVKRPGPSWLRLPVGMHAPRLYVSGEEVDLSPFALSGELIAPRVRIPERFDALREVHVVLRVDVPKGHYDGQGDGTIGMTGGMALAYPVEEEVIRSARCADGIVTVLTNEDEYRFGVAR